MSPNLSYRLTTLHFIPSEFLQLDITINTMTTMLQLKFSRIFVSQKCWHRFYMTTENIFNKNKKIQKKDRLKRMWYKSVSIATHWKECIYSMILFQFFNFHHSVWSFLMDATYFQGSIMKFPKKIPCNMFWRKLRGK